MAGKGLIRDQVMMELYNKIAEQILLTKVNLGGDGYIKPDEGRVLTQKVVDITERFITPLEVQLHLLECKGYTCFQFSRVVHDYHKWAFTAFKADGSQNFSRAEDDAATGPIWFRGKSKEEAVYHAITHEGLMFGPGAVSA